MLTTIEFYLNAFAGYLWGWPMLILLVGTGISLTLQLRGLTFTMLVPALIDIFKPQPKNAGQGMISNRSALLTALAATVGTGNIAGVATAIVIGGPGAMFWMWISGLFGMALKYSETLLGVHYRIKTADGTFRGGPMYYLTHGAGHAWLGMLFALFLSFAALSIGGMVQSNSVADALKTSFNFNPTMVGAVMTIAAATIMFGGLKRIARMADAVVPFMIALYAISGTLVLVANASYVPELFAAIFRDAFTGTAATGGFVGSTLLMAMRYGLARGVFANESGLGSAPIVAATAQTRHPTEQALISMTQTFIDTFFVCTFTGLVILVTGAWQSGAATSGGASLTQLAFNTGLGGITIMGHQLGSAIVALCLLLFAFTTVLGWGYYGQQGAVYLFGKRVATPYMVFFLLCTFFGAAVLDLATTVRQGVTFIWTIADITTGLMMLPNLLALWLLGPKIRSLTSDYLRNRKTGNFQHPAFHFAAPVPSNIAPSHIIQPAAAAAPKVATKILVKPASKPAKPAPKPAAKPVARPAIKPVAKPKSVAKPAAKAAPKPAPKPATKPAPKPVVKPVAKVVAKPAPAPKPTPQPVAKPAAAPAPQPAAAPKPVAPAKPATPAPKPAEAPKPATTTFSARSVLDIMASQSAPATPVADDKPAPKKPTPRKR